MYYWAFKVRRAFNHVSSIHLDGQNRINCKQLSLETQITEIDLNMYHRLLCYNYCTQ